MSERLQTFLDAVTAEIRCQEVHAEIRDELQEHVLSLQDGYIAAGTDAEAALEQAIVQMGAPAEIGRRFDQVHRPRIEWGLIALTALLTLVGLWVSWAGEGRPLNRLSLIGLGAAIGGPLLFADYRRLRRWGWPLFGLTSLLVAFVTLSWGQLVESDRMNGWYLFLVASPLLFALGLTAIVTDWKWQRRWATPLAFGLLMAPILVYGKDFVSFSMTYAILWSVQFFASRPPKLARIGFGAFVAIGAALMAHAVLSAPYRLARLLAWLNLRPDPNGAGYHLQQSLSALREAGLLGHGANLRPDWLSDPTGDFVFPYLVHTFGWVGGCALLVLIAWFGMRLLRAARQIREPFGASLMRLIGASLLLDGGWNLLMVTGLLPVMAAPLPFISRDGALVYQFALMGLALGIYRRKDLQARATRKDTRPGAPA